MKVVPALTGHKPPFNFLSALNHMIRHLLFATLLIFSNLSLAKDGPHPNAAYSQQVDGYEIVLIDKRRLMAHDITGLFRSGYTVECHIRTKEISGVVAASQLDVFELETIDKTTQKRQLKNILGEVRIEKDVLKIDMQVSVWEDPSREHRTYEFNGTYKLTRKSEK